jgi:hypothetical protein
VLGGLTFVNAFNLFPTGGALTEGLRRAYLNHPGGEEGVQEEEAQAQCRRSQEVQEEVRA